jgi:hypothetical protein
MRPGAEGERAGVKVAPQRASREKSGWQRQTKARFRQSCVRIARLCDGFSRYRHVNRRFVAPLRLRVREPLHHPEHGDHGDRHERSQPADGAEKSVGQGDRKGPVPR